MNARDCRVLDYEVIKSRTPIREVLSRYGVLFPDGRDHFRVACPVHPGQDRNMSVDGRRGLVHCFVCGASGSVIDLVAGLEGIPTQEAAATLSYGLGDVGLSRNLAAMR